MWHLQKHIIHKIYCFEWVLFRLQMGSQVSFNSVPSRGVNLSVSHNSILILGITIRSKINSWFKNDSTVYSVHRGANFRVSSSPLIKAVWQIMAWKRTKDYGGFILLHTVMSHSTQAAVCHIFASLPLCLHRQQQ